MWDIPSFRIRAYARTLNRLKKAQDEKDRLHFHARRLQAQLMLSQGFAQMHTIVPVRFVSMDLTPKGVAIYSRVELVPGQSVALNISSPSSFFVRGKVLS